MQSGEIMGVSGASVELTPTPLDNCRSTWIVSCAICSFVAWTLGQGSFCFATPHWFVNKMSHKNCLRSLFCTKEFLCVCAVRNVLSFSTMVVRARTHLGPCRELPRLSVHCDLQHVEVSSRCTDSHALFSYENICMCFRVRNSYYFIFAT